jgi:hypothetical protein
MIGLAESVKDKNIASCPFGKMEPKDLALILLRPIK